MKLLVSDVRYSSNPLRIFERAANLGLNVFNLDQPTDVVALLPDETNYANGEVPVVLAVDKFPDLANNHPAVIASSSRTYNRKIKAIQRGLVPMIDIPTHILKAESYGNQTTYLRLMGSEWLDYIRTLNGISTLNGSFVITDPLGSPDLEITAIGHVETTQRFIVDNKSYPTRPVVKHSEGASYTRLPDGDYLVTFEPGVNTFTCYCPVGTMIAIDASESNQVDPLDMNNANDMAFLLTDNPNMDLMENDKWQHAGAWSALSSYSATELGSQDILMIRFLTRSIGLAREFYLRGFRQDLESADSFGRYSPENVYIGLLPRDAGTTRAYFQASTLNTFSGSTVGSNTYLDERAGKDPAAGMVMHILFTSLSGGSLRLKRLTGDALFEKEINGYGLNRVPGSNEYSSDGTSGVNRYNKWSVSMIDDLYGTRRRLDIPPPSRDTNWMVLNSYRSDDVGLLGVMGRFAVEWETELLTLTVTIAPLGNVPDTVHVINDGRIPVGMSYYSSLTELQIIVRFDDESVYDTGVLTDLSPAAPYTHVIGKAGIAVNPVRNFLWFKEQ